MSERGPRPSRASAASDLGRGAERPPSPERAAPPVPAKDEGLAATLEGELRALLHTVRGSVVEELRLSVGGVRIALRREAGATPAALPAGAGTAAPPAGPEPGPQRAEVRAHMVGPFHRSREPDGPPLVSEGEYVEAGRALGVIETLGLATEVEAPASGHLERVLVEDGQPVEYGQVLAVIVADETGG